MNHSLSSVQYASRNNMPHPLDFSTPPPAAVPQPQPQEILDLSMRLEPKPSVIVKMETPRSSFVPITVLQQHLMQSSPLIPSTEPLKNSASSPDYCSTSSESSIPRGSPPNMSFLVNGMQQYPILPSLPQMITGNARSKPTRPFKAYPKDPLTLSVGVSSDSFLGHGSNEAYTEFRRRMLEQVQASSHGTTNSNKSRSNMKRPVSPEPPTSSDAFHQIGDPTSPLPGEEGKDAAYWERRRKNNEAAKRSRDARRHKEDEIAIRAAFLEQENMKLKYELAALRNETAKLRCMLYSN